MINPKIENQKKLKIEKLKVTVEDRTVKYQKNHYPKIENMRKSKNQKLCYNKEIHNTDFLL